MGAKIITEKEFWQCSGGLMPAPLQSTQLVSKKKDGNKYITITDKSTQSFADFVCRKLMLLMAIVAAIVAIAVVATGGAALIAIGALAGAAGAAVGAVMGSLICGQKVAIVRQWIGAKSNFKILGNPTVTGDHMMLCPIFGEQITYAPHIKNWWQAISLGAANFIGGVLEGAMVGAAIGGSVALIEGGVAALAEGGIGGLGRSALQLFKSLPGNLLKNFAASWTSGVGIGLRATTAIQHTAQTYGETGEANGGDFLKGVFGMETGTGESARRVFTGHGTVMDFIGLALWFTPAHKAAEEARNGKNGANEERPSGEETNIDETGRNSHTEPESEITGNDGEAFEDPVPLDNAIVGDIGEQAVVDRLIADGYIEILQIQNNSGHGVDIIGRNPTNGNVKAIEVKANSSRLNEAQKRGGEWFVEDRLERAANGRRGYGVPPNPPELPGNAIRAQQWIEDAPQVDYEVHRVPVDRFNGTVGQSDVTPWEPEPNEPNE
ncbi:hypothetical protein [Chitinophaga flava]|uniref:Uncharacterized protein n=1 Tax=Chitinophaga flava TaxID=2259036 RepID=A0A365XXZ9_9BACT|nr:hypothetical protein [Chitinophaga flava]RBL90455.1 hypothetical protein DF182_28765 [Chitinophaga flava]